MLKNVNISIFFSDMMFELVWISIFNLNEINFYLYRFIDNQDSFSLKQKTHLSFKDKWVEQKI